MLNRPRRNRKNPAIRQMIEETVLRPSNLIYPIFLSNASVEKEEIKSLPDQYRLNLNGVFKEIEEAMELGLRTFVLFPVVPEELKDSTASYGIQSDNFLLRGYQKDQRAISRNCLNE